MKQNELNKLYETIVKRSKSSDNRSYTKQLLKKGPKIIAQKIGEENAELIIDYLKGSKKRTIEEAVDVIYHFLVLLKSKKITMNEIHKELDKRK